MSVCACVCICVCVCECVCICVCVCECLYVCISQYVTPPLHHPTDTPASPPAAWPPSPSSSTTDDDVAGLHKTTVARGPGSCSRNQVRISDCHDATIYLLAPLECVSISCCSDCIVVVGAVGKLLRVERCVRLQLIAVCKRIYINASHDCIFYLGTNQPPVLLGDNRFVQVVECGGQMRDMLAVGALCVGIGSMLALDAWFLWL